MHVGIDFGTSNTSIARRTSNGAELIELERQSTSIPTAIFYGGSSREFAIGSGALDAYDSGDEGRLMRSIKSVLGTSLIEETTEIGSRRIPFRQVIADFLKSAIAGAEAHTGQAITSVTQGRPVSFNDRDGDLDKRAQTILESCLHEVGIRHVEFLEEPVAAARSVAFPNGREKLIFVVDIGGGTSDFSVVKIDHDNIGFDVLGSSGVYIGGNDFDRILSFSELTVLFGRSETLELNGLPAPTLPYATLSDWKSLNKLYTRAFGKEIAWMMQHSPNSRGIKALDHLVRNFEAHAYAKQTEDIKIGLSGEDTETFVYDTPETHLEKQVGRAVFEGLIEESVSRMDAVAGECLQRAGVSPEQITDIVMVGGSTFIPLVESRFARQFSNASMTGNDRFGAVAKGLALHAGAG